MNIELSERQIALIVAGLLGLATHRMGNPEERAEIRALVADIERKSAIAGALEVTP